MRRLPAALLALVAAFTIWVIRADCESYRLMWDQASHSPTHYEVVCTDEAGTPHRWTIAGDAERFVRLNGKLLPAPHEYTCNVQGFNRTGGGPIEWWSTLVVGKWTRCCEATGFRSVYTSSRTEWNEDGSVSTTHHLSRAVQGRRDCN